MNISGLRPAITAGQLAFHDQRYHHSRHIHCPATVTSESFPFHLSYFTMSPQLSFFLVASDLCRGHRCLTWVQGWKKTLL